MVKGVISGYYAEDCIINLAGTTITQNYGGIYCVDSNFTIFQSSVYNNTYNNDFTSCTGCVFVGVEQNPCMSLCTRDMCSVCNGSGSCLGCDQGRGI